ncbi:MAG: type II toxin-antitoxin system VapC family toxin [Rhizomicrobium sp.]|jgi:PIN domain nuclease of toxin-antitoxin system
MSRPLLLDTCAALWIMANDEMHRAAVDAIDEASDRREKIFVSPITGWEIGLKARKGKFRSQYSPQRWLSLLLALPQVAVAEMPPHILLESSFLPGNLVGDPADRIIAATAREFGYTVITRDRALLDYAAQGHLAVIEC